MPDPFIGEIRMFAGDFAPRGWALCNGQLLPIGQNAALFAILGTRYGGDGRATFALPDLRGRMPLHAGSGAGLSARTLGAAGGSETATLSVAQLPAHTHAAAAYNGAATSARPANAVVAGSLRHMHYAATPDTSMSPQAIGTTGGGEAHPNMPPFMCLNFIIALDGVFPPRS